MNRLSLSQRPWLHASFLLILIGFAACEPADNKAPILELMPGSRTVYVLGDIFVSPSFEVSDNRDCCLEAEVVSEGSVNTAKYGLYPVTYSVTDQSGNNTQLVVNYEVVVNKATWFDLGWNAADECSSGFYDYMANIQDCACPDSIVQVLNIGNFGPSARVDFELGGSFGEFATFNRQINGLTFTGTATLSCTADSLTLDYSVSDTLTTDVCTGLWVRP